jgi:multisubunit Na+/H+ antiporter MnhF subunit
METATYTVLLLAAAAFCYRLAIGPTLSDRVIAVNGMLVIGMIAIATYAAYGGSGAFLPVLVVVSLVGFVSTATIARYVERRG